MKSSEKTLNVVYATTYEANLFQCDIGTPLYSIETTAFDQTQQPIHRSRSLFLANKVTFTLKSEKK
ncbi:UTRA domain-containing protein [Halalkalibacter kiskunsagensis]|uniref:UTRA domain-containing protein n=1 Tax=Halalkalibacter kiskunsagensis TaxID=1548599 RepID=A0ABV6K907_9BACI